MAPNTRNFLSALTRPRAVLSLAAGLALVTLSACGGDDPEDGTDGTPTSESTPSATGGTATPEVEQTPERQWPEVGTARVITEDLNVRAGPGLEYLIVERLQPGDEVPVSGRWSGGRWLALPDIGWVAYDETWVELPMPSEELPPIALEESAFEFQGALHPEEARADIPVVDQIVSAVVAGDREAVLDLASTEAPSDGEEVAEGEATPEGTGEAEGAPEGVEDSATPPNSACQDTVQPASELSGSIDAFFTSQSGAAGPPRLYAVIGTPGSEDEDPTFSAIFAFEGGEARQVWIVPGGGEIAWFSLGCKAMTPGELLRLDPGTDHFFWLRPVAPEPLDAVG